MSEKLIHILLSASFLLVLFGIRNDWGFITKYNRTEPRIVIIGGGVSGVAAATRLIKHGFRNVKILEAENRIGGRVNTVRFGENYIDLGAHWIHGEEGNPVFEIASKVQLAVHSRDFENIIFLTDNGEIVKSGMDIYIELGEMLENVDLKYINDSLNEYIVSRGTQIVQDKLSNKKLTNAFIDWCKKMACTGEGCDDIKDVSVKGAEHFKRSPGERYVDLGAHWIHGEKGNIVHEIASNMGLAVHSKDFTNVIFVTEDGEEVPNCMELYLQLGEILESDALQHEKGSLYDFVVSRCKKIAEHKIKDEVILNAFVNWTTKFESTVEGCDDLKDVSAPGLVHYKRCEGDSLATWKDGGYNSIVEILLNMHPLCDGPTVDLEENIFLNCEVTEIDWSGLEALIKCANGTFHRADHVIVTVSLGVLKEKHSKLFKPALPESKLDAIRGLGMGTVNKIYLYFPYQWWPENISGFSLLHKSTCDNNDFLWEKEIIGFYTESSAPKVMGAWIVGNAARETEMYSDQQIINGCYRVLLQYLGKKYAIPKPSDIMRSKWFSNPNFRGVYSFRSLSTDVLKTSAENLSKSITNFYNRELLMFAGEATHSDYYSTVHGALESGWREADKIKSKYSM